MYIIFGESAATEVAQTNLVLEVDTIRLMPMNATAKSYCVLEQVNSDPAMLENNKKIHEDLIRQYRLQNWDYCIKAIKGLRGAWGGQLDEFYNSLLERVVNFSANPVDNWDYAVMREVILPS